MGMEYRFVYSGGTEFYDAYIGIFGDDGNREETEEYLDGDFWVENHTLKIDDCYIAQFWARDNIVFTRFFNFDDLDFEGPSVERLIEDWINDDPSWVRLGANASPFVTGEEVTEVPTQRYIIFERAGYVTNFWGREDESFGEDHDSYIAGLPCSCGSDEDNPCVCN